MSYPELLDRGIAHWQAGQVAEAEAICAQLLTNPPATPDDMHRLGLLARVVGRHAEARQYLEAAVALCPKEPIYFNSLGVFLTEIGELQTAVRILETAMRLQPKFADAYYNLGNTMRMLGNVDLAMQLYRRALSLDPNIPEAHNNLGALCQAGGNFSEAMSSFLSALRLDPSHAAVHLNNIGNLLWEQGQPEAAIETYRRSLERDPANASHHSNLVHATLFHPGLDLAAQARELAEWSRRHAAQLIAAVRPAHGNDRSPERPLRIGYVSPHFRSHVVGRNILPLLREHDRTQFEVFCYSGVTVPDELTRTFRALANSWQDVAGWSDHALAERIRLDRIDILVDLTLHLPGNRLLTFARKPAPVQVSFAGYPGSAGLPAMDYRITDPYLEPPGLDAGLFPDRAIRLPHSFWCFEPPSPELPVGPLPAVSTGAVTFGSLSNFAKVNEVAVRLWSAVLHETPRARLVILSPHGPHRQEMSGRFAAFGVDPARIEFVPRQSREEYFKLFGRIDVILDTFPYHGHTTSCEALWMGVPVVTLAGGTIVSRGGVSILTNAGLPDLVAGGPAEFVRIAAGLAADLGRLTSLRAGLRERMRASPLTNARQFTRDFEAACRGMWRDWCAA